MHKTRKEVGEGAVKVEFKGCVDLSVFEFVDVVPHDVNDCLATR